MRHAPSLAAFCLVAMAAFRLAHAASSAAGAAVGAPCWALMTFAVAAFIGSER